ncbi:hypothetical protein O181_128093 [Austropuccinia psidii MF-1]|uniref:Uncharacterized protein n=1 Tax=Austropuccinia psidii MF-1 TaxID=1389203 RepID=A0A9Q3Q7J8_9BASI|nr:hypothetical protein [Austropuccinia psidii MF-1]
MASFGKFDPSQTYVGYKEVEVLDTACTKVLMKGKEFYQHFNLKSSKLHVLFVGKKIWFCSGILPSNIKRYLWSKKYAPFGSEFPVSEAPNPDGTSRYSSSERGSSVGQCWRAIQVDGRPTYSSSEVPISRINNKGVVKQIRWISDYSPDPDSEGSDELDGEEVEGVLNSIGHHSSTSSSQPAAKDSKVNYYPVTLEISNQYFPSFLLILQVHPLPGLSWFQK